MFFTAGRRILAAIAEVRADLQRLGDHMNDQERTLIAAIKKATDDDAVALGAVGARLDALTAKITADGGDPELVAALQAIKDAQAPILSRLQAYGADPAQPVPPAPPAPVV